MMTNKSYEKSAGIRWWIWASIVLGAPALMMLIYIWMRRREEKEQTSPIVRIDITPPSLPAEPTLPADKPAKAKPDDLRLVEGIGPKVASLLKTSGITTFAQLAATDANRIGAILREAGLPFIDPSTWPAQADLAAAGQWESLKALQVELKGGRQG